MIERLDTKGLTTLGLAALFATGFMVATSTFADNDDDEDDGPMFTDRSVEGDWGWSGAGTLVFPVDSEQVPTVGLGTTTFDGEGGCSVTSIVNVDGTIFGPVDSDTCTYSVNPDGTGSSVATFSEPPLIGEAPVTFVIVDEKREIRFIQNNQFVVTFIAKRL